MNFPLKPLPLGLTLLTVLALLLSSALVVTPVSSAGDIEVANNNNADVGSLRSAIKDIPPGGTITFDPSLSGQTITLSLTLVIDKSLTIDGSSLAVPITISGNNSVGVFTVDSTVEHATLDSLKIINGNRVSGGGISNFGHLTVTNCTISGNKAQEDGGGIYNQGELTIFNSTLSGNIANDGSGGGIYNTPYAILNLNNSTLSGNTAKYDGGGIYNFAFATLTVTNSTLSGNTAEYDGGGIYNQGELTITNSTLSGNMAEVANSAGGGIYNYASATLTVTNSTLSGNKAEFDGGGIMNNGLLIMTNSTLSGNHADRGGGILNDGTLTLRNVTLYENKASASNGGGIINYANSTLDFVNTIIAGSTGGDCVNKGTILPDSTHNMVTDGSCALLDDDPMLGPLADSGGPTLTHALLPGSPAIDAGSTEFCPNTDQRGVARPQDGIGDGVPVCDIGAFEFNPAMDGVNFIYLPLILR